MSRQGIKQTLSTDTLMKSTFYALQRDFANVAGDHFCAEQTAVLKTSVEQFRSCKWPTVSTAPVYIFKRVYQLQNFFKRYIFEQDLYTPKSLVILTDEKYIKTQERIASQPIRRTEMTHKVLQRARVIIKNVLGEFSDAEHMDLCRFGKRASLGVPAKRAYLDVKMGQPLSGTLGHIKWFTENYLPSDRILSDLLDSMSVKPCYQVCDCLSNTNVPKSFKSRRGITPNSTIGSLYSYGIGKMIQKRLKEKAKLDIAKLQRLHQRMAQYYSITTTHATGDLSEASHSYYSDLVNMLVPREWYNKLKLGRASYVSVNGAIVWQSSFMGMGIGYTFPLQTLCFYGLLKAIVELAQVKGKVSVYGDDLIYPVSVHKYVVHVFGCLRFKLNTDKTFVVDNFRESCGGDYYRGVDVRPCNIEGAYQQLGRSKYLAFIYKLINSLLRRWDKSEIENTLLYLFRQILLVTDSIFQVPPHFPDYSGIKVEVPIRHFHYDKSSDMAEFWYLPWSPIRISEKGNQLSYEHLKEMSDKRVVKNQHAYYWDTLRSTSIPYEKVVPLCGDMPIRKYLQRGYVWCRIAPESIMTWCVGKTKRKVRTKSGKRVYEMYATVPLKGSSFIISNKSQTSSWLLGSLPAKYRVD